MSVAIARQTKANRRETLVLYHNLSVGISMIKITHCRQRKGKLYNNTPESLYKLAIVLLSCLGSGHNTVCLAS